MNTKNQEGYVTKPNASDAGKVRKVGTDGNPARLVMRNTGGTVGIVLDGRFGSSDYVIKIGPDLAAENNLSKLRVTNICDNKGNNCKKIADLSTGIKINGTNGLVCVKTNDKEINCNQTLGAGVITIKQGGISKGSFNVNTNSAQTIELSGAIALEGTNSRFCTKKNDDTIQCNVTTGAILNVSVPSPTPTLSRGSTTTIGSVGGTEFKVTTPANPHNTGRNIVANTENGTSAGTTDNTNTYLNYAEGSDANSKSHIQIQGAGGTTVSAENNVITIYSTGGGNGGTSKWNGNASVIYPNATTTKVAIGTTNANNYTLNVNGSGRVSGKLNVGDNFWIVSSQQRQVYVPSMTCPLHPTYATSPTIRYNGTLAFRDNDLIQCSNGYTEFGNDGRVGIGGPSESATKLSVYGHTRIYSNASATERYIDLYNDGVSRIISKWSNMVIGLTGDQNILGIVLPSAYIRINKTNIGINKNPSPSTRNGSTQQGYYSPTLQVSGSIQISSEHPVSNSTQANNKMICRREIEGTIAYYSGNFYGCGKTSSNTYKWRSFDTSSVAGDSLPSAPAAGGLSL